MEKEEEIEEEEEVDGGEEYGWKGQGWAVDDVIGCLVDLGEQSMIFHVNGVVQVRSKCPSMF